MAIGIYCIENLLDGKKYIGKSIDIKRRLAAHKAMLSRPKPATNCNLHMYAAVKLQGIDNFTFGAIEINNSLTPEQLSEREIYWLDFYQSYDRNFGYNMVRDSTYRSGYTPSEAKRAKISKANKGRRLSDETRQKMSLSRQGKPFSEERKKAMRDKPRKIWSAEARKNKSEATSQYSYQKIDISGKILHTYARIKDVTLDGYTRDGVIKASKLAHDYIEGLSGFVYQK